MGMSSKQRIYKILKDYRAGKIDKYGAMDALNLDTIYDLYSLLQEFQLAPSPEAANYQSDGAAPLSGYFAHG